MESNISEECLEKFVSAARRVASHGLVLCGSGNLSWRIDDQTMLISTTCSWLAELTREQVAVCRIRDGACLNSKIPSIELGFHRAILCERRDVNVVLHFQSPYATILACRKDQTYDCLYVIPEIPCYIGPVAVVPYLEPGSDCLAAAVASALRDHDLANLRNHGQVTVGGDFHEAFQRAAYFEFASAICVRGGESVECLGKEAVESLHRVRQGSRKPPDLPSRNI